MMVKRVFSTFCLGKFIQLVLPLQLLSQRNPLQTLCCELFNLTFIFTFYFEITEVLGFTVKIRLANFNAPLSIAPDKG